MRPEHQFRNYVTDRPGMEGIIVSAFRQAYPHLDDLGNNNLFNWMMEQVYTSSQETTHQRRESVARVINDSLPAEDKKSFGFSADDISMLQQHATQPGPITRFTKEQLIEQLNRMDGLTLVARFKGAYLKHHQDTGFYAVPANVVKYLIHNLYEGTDPNAVMHAADFLNTVTADGKPVFGEQYIDELQDMAEERALAKGEQPPKRLIITKAVRQESINGQRVEERRTIEKENSAPTIQIPEALKHHKNSTGLTLMLDGVAQQEPSSRLELGALVKLSGKANKANVSDLTPGG